MHVCACGQVFSSEYAYVHGCLPICLNVRMCTFLQGGAASNTKAILERAKGKVLLIDEAYVLDPRRKNNQYGGNVLDTLVEKLDGEAGSDIAVILAGYKQEMFDMLENNAGLRRRFNIDEFGIHFEDMTDEELRQVLLFFLIKFFSFKTLCILCICSSLALKFQVLIRSVSKSELVLADQSVEEFVVRKLSQKRRLPNFGNAGTVLSMLNAAKVNKAERLSVATRAREEARRRGDAKLPLMPNPNVLLKVDFEEQDDGKRQEDLFSKLYNIEHIQQQLEELEALVAAAKQDGKDPAVIIADNHLVFTGALFSFFSCRNVNKVRINLCFTSNSLFGL